MRVLRFAAMSLLLASTTAVPSAAPIAVSDPIGCYGIVEKVVMEPDEKEPTAIQIWGAFALASDPVVYSAGGNNNTVGAVRVGYLYLTCAKDREATCFAEWKDIKASAGKGEAIGFGSRFSPAPIRVRPATEKVGSPD